MSDDWMRAWVVEHPGPIATGPLKLVERRVPDPGPGEIRVRIAVCGVCRTDLHLAEGDLLPHHPEVVPGHEIVGVVDAVGPGTARFAVGERAGIAWLRHTDLSCRFCLRGDENLCLNPGFTGWDADGGYAEAAVVDERYAYHLPDDFDDEEAAPLLCAGIIGYRSLKRARLRPGGRLGIYGYGASAHLIAQIAEAQGAAVYVATREEEARRLALDLGATWAGGLEDQPPEPLDAAILFTPVGDPVLPALAALDRGATLAIAGIHLTDIPPLNYERHLFEERSVCSVTANTRADGEELLRLAARIRPKVETTVYPLDQADQALADLASGGVNGVAVLRVAEPSR